MPKKSTNTSSISQDPLIPIINTLSVNDLRDALYPELVAKTMGGDRLRRLVSQLTTPAAYHLLDVLDTLAGSVMVPAETADGKSLRFIAQAFTMTVTGPAEDIERVISKNPDGFSGLLREAGFAQPDTNVLLMIQPYTLDDMNMIGADAVFAGGLELIRISATDRHNAGAFTQIFPKASEMPEIGIVTRTFVGYTFNALGADQEHAPQIGVPEGDLSDIVKIHNETARRLFGDRCTVSIPTPWILSMQSALAMRLDEAFDLAKDIFEPENVEVFRKGERMLFRIFGPGDPGMGISVVVPTAIALRCQQDPAFWAESALGLNFDDMDMNFDDPCKEDDFGQFDQSDVEWFLANLSELTQDEEPLENDTTNLIPFPTRPR